MTAGAPAAFTVELRAREPVRQLQLRLWVRTVEGHRVCANCNGDYRGEWDLEPGGYRVTAHLAGARFLRRAYTVTLQRMRGWGADIYDDVTDAVRFDVLGRDVLGTGIPLLPNCGVTWMPARYEITPLAGAGAAL